MIIDCISDLHGYYPDLDGGDLLIVAGDLTASHTEEEFHEFAIWMNNQEYEKIIFISGNHDKWIEEEDKYQESQGYNGPTSDPNEKIEYLCDSGTEFEGLKIWGSPWSLTFPGMNPHCKAFTVDTEEELTEKWELIPDDIDILITHSPPYGILDKNLKGEHCGSVSLRNITLGGTYFKKYRYHIFGHIHECGGKSIDLTTTICINASHVNEYYQPVNKPIRIEL